MSFSQQVLQATQRQHGPLVRRGRGRGLQRVPIYTYQVSGGGLGSLGQVEDRPSFDYVRAGDLIRLALFLDATFATPPIAAFRSALGSSRHVRLVRLDQSRLGSLISGYAGELIVEVQPLNDFNKLDDFVRLVAGIAQGAGLRVLIGSTRGEFVSKVETTGGTLSPSIPSPSPLPGRSESAGIGDSVSNFVSSLTQSPVTLAVILGAAVVLVIAAKK